MDKSVIDAMLKVQLEVQGQNMNLNGCYGYIPYVHVPTSMINIPLYFISHVRLTSLHSRGCILKEN